MNILITGGSGFIGSNIAVALTEAGHKVTCFDNLSRRGTERILKRILDRGCVFVHGDIRSPEDFTKLSGDYDMMIECSAEPSALVGSQGADVQYIVNTNLVGAFNCFEWCRKRSIPVLFLSTSRVYPYDKINSLSYLESSTRFQIHEATDQGISNLALSEKFSLDGYRTFYGATKLSAELLLQEYAANFGLPVIINRCGVIAGPWQLGKVDQGVFTHWVASHHFKKELRYIGFGGKGKQVRDLLHIDDLIDLIKRQIAAITPYRGEIFNVGGAQVSNLSLVETTAICEEITGNKAVKAGVEQTRPGDVIWYISDTGKVEAAFGWKPSKPARMIITDIHSWLQQHEGEFLSIFGAGK